MGARLHVGRRNATFQHWQALLGNRRKRQRAGEFLVQGVRPITMALRAGWPLTTVLCRAEGRLSAWALDVVDTAGAPVVEVDAGLLAELGDRPGEDPPELVAVAAVADDDLGRIAAGDGFCAAVFDRPANPGNVGSVIRSADALGLAGVIVTGHAADVYDPQCVRASTGSLFGLPVVRAASHAPVLDWARTIPGLRVIGTDERGAADLADCDLTGPALLLIGNETTGLGQSWRDACDVLARVPMTGTASSLNAANAAAIAFYEARVQRARGGPGARISSPA